MSRVTIGQADGPQWLQVQRGGDGTVHISYLEGVVSTSSLELPTVLAAELGIELAGLAPIRTEYRAAFPQQLLPGSPFEHSFGDQEHAEGIARYVNRRLAAAGLPESAHVETREVYARPWISEQSPSRAPHDL